MSAGRPARIIWLDTPDPVVADFVRSWLPPGYTLQTLSHMSREAAADALADGYEYCIVSGRLPIDGELLSAARGLRFIQKVGAGYDILDLEAAAARNIGVARTPGLNAVPVAEHTIGLMLAAARRTVYLHQKIQQGQWLKWALRRESVELAGRRLGLVGFGHIGREVARRAAAFGMDVLYYTRSGPKPSAEEGNARYVPLDDLLAQSDVLSLHIPASPETHRFIDRSRLFQLPRDAIVINTARGAVLDYDALYEGLTSGHILAAGLDVFPQEPPPPHHPLFSLPNVVLTPHVGAGTRENLLRSYRRVVDNIVRVHSGEPLPPEDVLVPLADTAERTAP